VHPADTILARFPVFYWVRHSQYDDGKMSRVAGLGGDVRKTTAVKLTYDDLVLFPDDGLRHELIDGVHYVTPPPNRRHQQILGRLYLSLGSWLETHPAGEALLAPFDVVFTQHDVVEPDLLFVLREHEASKLIEKHALGADLVVEVASPGTRRRDATIKRELYQRSGVREYWIVEPDHSLVRVYRLDGTTFAPPFELSGDRADMLTTPLCQVCRFRSNGSSDRSLQPSRELRSESRTPDSEALTVRSLRSIRTPAPDHGAGDP
jgi:Uma2 family endonuclease